MAVYQHFTGFMKTILVTFTSTKTVLWLFAFLIFFLIPLTLFTEYTTTLLIPVKTILAVIGLNLVVCTISKFGKLRISTLTIHLGSIVILIGGFISTFGFVATVNIYEGTSVDTVFRWDVEQDDPLGFDLKVSRINFDFYPVPLKIGVLKNGEKMDLVMTRTGDHFSVEGYRIELISFDPFTREVYLDVESSDGVTIGTMSTSAKNNMPLDFPLDFKLVAFQDPVARRMWVDLELQKDEKVIAAGTSEVNEPLKWEGMQFFLTRVTADEFGRPYAGIQISKDPGLPVVYSGIIIFCLGLLLTLQRWMKANRKSAKNEV